MKKLAILAMLALEFAVCGCGANPPTTVTTTTSGNWEAQLFGGTGPTAQLNFVTSFNVTDTTGITNEPLDITGFGFFNAGSCFTLGPTAVTESGTATLNTNSAGQVTGTLNLVVNSTTSGSVLTLNGNLTGTSNGTTTTTGTLSNGVVVGNWTLTPGASDQSCATPANANSATFIMCQSAATCTVP